MFSTRGRSLTQMFWCRRIIARRKKWLRFWTESAGKQLLKYRTTEGGLLEERAPLPLRSLEAERGKGAKAKVKALQQKYGIKRKVNVELGLAPCFFLMPVASYVPVLSPWIR